MKGGPPANEVTTMRKLPALVMTLCFSIPLAITPQSRDEAKGGIKASPVRLLSGYEARLGAAIDTWGGTISKEGGVKIAVSMGCTLGSVADSVGRKDVIWREEQVVNGMQTVYVYTKWHELIVTFPRQCANFQGKIRNQQDLAEMLITVLTFDPTHGYPIEPGAAER
jgi:hypothetical protein